MDDELLALPRRGQIEGDSIVRTSVVARHLAFAELLGSIAVSVHSAAAHSSSVRIHVDSELPNVIEGVVRTDSDEAVLGNRLAAHEPNALPHLRSRGFEVGLREEIRLFHFRALFGEQLRHLLRLLGRFLRNHRDHLDLSAPVAVHAHQGFGLEASRAEDDEKEREQGARDHPAQRRTQHRSSRARRSVC